jgi:hypothetical protein
MIWLTWRQFRAQTIVAAAAMAAVAVLLGLTGLRLAHLYGSSGTASCAANSNCGQAANTFLTQVNATLLNHLPLLFGTALIVVPVILGIFWGAPLITRELEAGTHRLAWSQGVSRTNWLAVKLGVAVAAAMVTAGVFSLLVTWSAGPIDKVNLNLLQPSVFSERGIAPAGYAAFAVVLGAAAGLLIRRTVPAMAVTLVVFTAVQFAMRALRHYLLAPVRIISAIGPVDVMNIAAQPGHARGAAGSTVHLFLTGNAGVPGAWVLSTQFINAAGHAVSSVTLPASASGSALMCAGPAGLDDQAGPAQSCLAQLASHGYRQLVSYQPASRFWAFQWYETAIFLALAAALAGFCFWWIRRRMS